MAIDKDMVINQPTIFPNHPNSNLIRKLSKSQLGSHIAWLSMKKVELTHGEKVTASSLDTAKKTTKNSQNLLKDFRTFILSMFHVQEEKRIPTVWL